MNSSRNNPQFGPAADTAAQCNASDLIAGFISSKSFPCVGAKSALNKDRIRFGRFASLGSALNAPQLNDALLAFSAEFENPGNGPVSYMAIFDNDEPLSEMEFEERLWEQLQSMHDVDQRRGFDWNPQVSADPGRHDFSFSNGGRAFFVVGLHPGASRLARRAPMPCMVFNFHDQFESLKASGKYQSMQDAIRARDMELQGSINPVLARFGDSSEARQYSGRAVEAGWKCPFHH